MYTEFHGNLGLLITLHQQSEAFYVVGRERVNDLQEIIVIYFLHSRATIYNM